ncbi:MAG: glycosyltransferase [Patescibacteria group bacterium]
MNFVWKSDLILDKYQYAKTNPYFIRTIAVLGILTTLLMAYGFSKYIFIDRTYLIIFGPIIVIFTLNKLMRFVIQLFYPKFDIREHERFVNRFWSTYEEPSVDVFLPWAGEDLAVHEEVVKAVSNLTYKNYKCYMLDDIGSTDHKALADKYGFVYLSRPNKGVYKKSGNLQFGYENSHGEYVLVLDADFIPIRDTLRDLVPYLASDNKIGILQTPQYFEQNNFVHKRSKIEFGGGNIVEDFYRVLLPCRDEFQAAMCVGTSAIYRRSAIQLLDGTPKVHASEDLATGLLITQYGYYVKYLPLIISMGKSPETFQGYFKQHMRWCSGNLVFAKYWPNARLSVVARLIYLINPLHYLSEASTVIFGFQFLVLLYFHADVLSIQNSIYFLPYVVLSRIIIPFNKKNKNKLGTKLAAMNNCYTYFYTYLRMLINGVPEWQPTGVRYSGLHRDFERAMDLGVSISTLYLASFIIVVINRPEIFGNYNTYVVLAWSLYSVFWHTLYLTNVMKYVHPIRLKYIQNNYFQKALLYARSNVVLVLYSILMGAASFWMIVSVLNPSTPTAKVIEEKIITPVNELTNAGK